MLDLKKSRTGPLDVFTRAKKATCGIPLNFDATWSNRQGHLQLTGTRVYTTVPLKLRHAARLVHRWVRRRVDVPAIELRGAR